MVRTDNSDYGFLVSQLGVDVTSAADQQLITASSWKNMMIHSTGTVSVPFGSTVDIEHDLGYPPMWLVWQVNSGESHLINTTVSEARMTSTELSLTNDFLSTGPVTLRYYIYRIPINQNFTAPIYKTSEIDYLQKDKDIGIKVMKPGKKYTSTDLRDYNYHSGTRSPMIHSVTYGATTNQTFTDPSGGSRSGNFLRYTNNLGYVPIFFGFYSGDNQIWTSLFGPEQSPPKLFVFNNGDMAIQTISAGQYGSIVAFKDPYSVGDVQEITV